MNKAERQRRNHKILLEFLGGDNRGTLAESHSTSLTTVNDVLRSHGVKKREENLAKTQKVIKLLGEGKTYSEITEYCGKSYSAIRNLERRHGIIKPFLEKQCVVCDDPFTPRAANHITCSPSCRRTNSNSAVGKHHRKKILLKCGWCREWRRVRQYATTRSDSPQRFCSLSCAKRYEYKHLSLRNDEIVWYREIQDMSFRRIGEIFGISPSTAREVFYRQRLKRDLAR